jgi:hypothetical protein
VIGGYAVQLRAEWSVDLPARYSRFNSTSANLTLSPPARSKKFCAIRKKGSVVRAVCLDGNLAKDYELTAAGFVERDMMAVGTEAVAVIAVPAGADRDVYMVSTRGVLLPLFGAAMADNSGAPCVTVSCEVEDAMAVPPCGQMPGKMLLKIKGSGTGQVKQMNARGGGTIDFPLGKAVFDNPLLQAELDNAGCVTRVDPGGGAPTLRQVITFHLGTRGATELTTMVTRAVYNCGAMQCMGNELFPGAGAAFTTGSEPRLLATSVDATGVNLIEVVLAPDQPNRDLFVERSRTPSAGIPDRAVVGNYDADGELDWFWNMSARRGATFEVAYAREVAQQRLEALSLALPIAVSALATGDLTGDGYDDILIIGNETIAGNATLAVVPMNAPAPTVSVPTDMTCSP